jgi:hypothetical protein
MSLVDNLIGGPSVTGPGTVGPSPVGPSVTGPSTSGPSTTGPGIGIGPGTVGAAVGGAIGRGIASVAGAAPFGPIGIAAGLFGNVLGYFAGNAIAAPTPFDPAMAVDDPATSHGIDVSSPTAPTDDPGSGNAPSGVGPGGDPGGAEGGGPGSSGDPGDSGGPWHKGGRVTDHKPGRKNNLRITAQEGEYVLKRSAVDLLGAGNLKKLNMGNFDPQALDMALNPERYIGSDLAKSLLAER